MEYLEQVIEGLRRCPEKYLKKYDLVFSCEPHEATWEYVESLDLPVNDIHVHKNMNNMGCVPNSFRSSMLSYYRYGSEFDVFIEDDDIPSEDLFELAEFYYNLDYDPKCVAYGFYGFNPDHEGEYEVIRKADYFWGIGYATKREQWMEHFRDYWLGWGHGGVLDKLEREELYILHPVQTRIKNVGVEGAHCNAHVYNNKRLGDYKINQEYITYDKFKIDESNMYTNVRPPALS
jgi:hypothetical protein